MSVWSPMEDVNIIVRTLLGAIHVHVIVDIYFDQMATIAKVHIVVVNKGVSLLTEHERLICTWYNIKINVTAFMNR